MESFAENRRGLSIPSPKAKQAGNLRHQPVVIPEFPDQGSNMCPVDD